jgi:hypothetical protein
VLSALALAPAAHAGDLLILDSEQATVSGNQNYGFVYVDGELRLTGDTTITAGSIYLGPNASLRTCYVEGTGNGGCTAGRSLTLRSSGQLTLASGIDLTAATGTVRNAGSLTLQGAQVAVGGDVNTTGNGGGASGAVSITSAGQLSVGAITAYGAGVNLSAGGAIDVGGDIQTQGTNTIASPDPASVQPGAPVTVASSAGDVRITGNVNASGRDAPANAGAGLSGGRGADISITGSDVRVAGLDATGGSSAEQVAGGSGRITINARGAFDALGRLDTTGPNSNLSQAMPGGPITVGAGGSVVLAGGAFSGGGQGSIGGMPGGDILVKGQTVTTGQLFASGANAPNSGTPGDGGRGGTVAVTAAGNASLASIQSYGGNGATGRAAGHGGSISVTSTTGSIATGRVSSQAGSPNQSPGVDGGPVSLSAQTDLTVADALDTSGSSASGDVTPARPGGNAGDIVLRAATGSLTLGDRVRADGGSGAGNPNNGEFGGAGGHGGHIDIVTGTLGPIVAISTHGGGGGDGGDDRGPGGAGGAVFAWTDSPLFDDQRVVDTDGGDGNPTGPAGAKNAELSPSAVTIDPATGVLSFTSRSADAEKYRVLRSVGGAAPEAILDSTATSGLKPAAPACVPVTFTVVAVQTGLGWTSAASSPVSYTRPASDTQACGDAPALSAAQKLRFSKRKLRRAKWRATLKLRSSGIGTVQVTLLRAPRKGHKTSAHALAKFTTKLTKPGSQNVRITLPKAARRTGRYMLRLVTTAPDGKGHKTTTLKLEVRR